MLILPAIDLIEGRCVRLRQGDYNEETRYEIDPVAMAKEFEAAGAKWLHIVDLEGAKTGTPRNLGVLRAISAETSLSIEFGGGVRTLASARDALAAGAKRVIIGTKVVHDPLLASEFFAELDERVVAGLDCRDGFLAISGWVETSDISVFDAARRVEEQGAKRVILTDIARDGMLQGPNLELLSQLLEAVQMHVIQSGGVSSLADIQALASLPNRGCEGVIVGKALYEGALDLGEALRNAERPSLNLS